MYQTPSRIQDVHTYATFPPMDSINQSTVASSGWFIGMILALLFLLAVCVTVCLIKRNRSVSATLVKLTITTADSQKCNV